MREIEAWEKRVRVEKKNEKRKKAM